MVFQALTAGETGEINPKVDSYDMAAENIAKGKACFIVAGFVTLATSALAADDHPPFVPHESKDNSGGSPGDLQIGGVGDGQVITLTLTTGPLDPGEYAKIGATTGEVIRYVTGTDAEKLIYAQYLGKDTGVFARAGSTPFRETLSGSSIKPEILATGEVGYFRVLKK